MERRILIVDDEKKIRTILTQILLDEGFTVRAAESGEEAVSCVEAFDPALILMDQNMPGIDGIEAMAGIKKRRPRCTVVILTAFGSIPLAVEAMRKGAYDYLTKPFDNDELLLVIERAFDHLRLVEEVDSLRKALQEKYTFENIVGASPPMQRLFEQMRRVCETNATVLIQGESGTGKELVAKAIHYNSPRKEKPLVSVNCGAVPVELIESEFFGHERGAFTDAKERKIGKFEQASGGTLLLDEIGELPIDAQVKLLRVLDERLVVRVGGKESVPVDVRVLAATNKDLEREVDAGRFRLDLLFRLNIFAMTVPPLRERKDDIPLLVERFIGKYNRELGLSISSVSDGAIRALMDYSWPGNVRDLENAVQSAMILARGDVLTVDDLPLRLRGYPNMNGETALEAVGLEELIERHTGRMEERLIRETLEKYAGSRTATAAALKISRKTLFNKMKKYGML